MSEELNQTGNLLDGIAATPPRPMDGAQIGGEVIGAAGGNVDAWGVEFNPAIHKTDAEGAPLLGSKKQFLMKKEAKKSAGQKIKEGLSRLWNGENQPEKEVSELNKIPPSDHELNQIPFENAEKQISSQSERADRSVILSSSAENSADLFFVGGSMLVGIEFLNQRERFHPQTAAIIAEYERRTGRQMDLPPGVALALGLGRIGYEIIQREPACKAKFETGARAIRENAGKYIRSKIPGLNRVQKQAAQSPGVADAA